MHSEKETKTQGAGEEPRLQNAGGRPKTLYMLRRAGMERLQRSGIDDAKTDSLLLLEAAAGIDLQQYLMRMQEPAGADVESAYDALISRRCTHEPLQYITGTADFCGLTFHVDSSVLIPRQDTETAVETALPYLTPDSRVLDLCTGSGCIIITLAKQAGLRDAAGSDISGKALAIAARNARELGCLDIRFIQSDLFEKITGRYDMIISNPPYIPSDVIGGLMQEVRDHEPHSALDGGADGLDFYREITAQAGAHLTPGGILLTEIGYDQGETAAARFEEAGFADVKAVRDLAGNNRVVYGRYVHV